MGDWIDRRTEKEQRDSLAEKIKAEATKNDRNTMYRDPAFCRLTARMKSDAERWKKSHKSLAISENGGKLTIHQPIFPAFHIDIEKSGETGISISGFQRPNREEQTPISRMIEVSCAEGSGLCCW